MRCLDDNDASVVLDGATPPPWLQDHLADCEACRRLVSELARGSVAEDPPTSLAPDEAADWLPRGTTLDRYQIIEQIGVGSAGAIYAAEDPELDRRIALKVLRAPAGTATTALLHEAKAMAKLAHPNVVAIHDVGIADGRAFIAMELVTGQTLRAWLAASHSWRAIRDAFVAAGRGLAAAHRAGLVHRDFKPDNVLVDAEQRVRVTDFGLSGPIDGAGSPAAMWIGTPAYMSPEQLRGEPATPASDQFAFCVALHEALLGRRPHLAAPAVATPPARDVVPRRILDAVRRGISFEPRDRHPTMDALIEALARDPAQRRAWWIGGAVAALAAVALVIAWTARGDAVCTGAEAKLAGIWDGGRRAELNATFARAAAPYLGTAAQNVERALDRYAQTWVAGHLDACRATRVRGDQSERVMDARMRCLAHRREQLRGVVDTLLAGDQALLRRAGEIVETLPSAITCAEPSMFEDRATPSATAARVDQHASKLAAADAQGAAGNAREALAMTAQVAASARDVADPTFQAHVSLQLARYQQIAGAYGDAEASVMAAIRNAEAARNDELRVIGWLELASMRAGARADQAKEALGIADAIPVELSGFARARTAIRRASTLRTLGDVATARSVLNSAVAELERDESQPLRLAAALASLGSLDERLGKLKEADDELRRALALRERIQGPDHPAVADVVASLAELANTRDEVPAARTLYERALAIYDRSTGPNSPAAGEIHYQLGHTLGVLGETATASQHLQHALSIARSTTPPNEALEAVVRGTIGDELARTGKLAEAIAEHEQALRIHERRRSVPNIAATEFALGDDHAKLRRFDDAVVHYQRAIDQWQAALGPDHLHLSFGLVGLGDALLALHKPRDALAVFERAAKIRSTGPKIYGAETSFGLARAHWELGARRVAIEHAEAARALYATAPEHEARLDEVMRWLGARRR
ncbi:MAG: tetratricopeptide repeat protein [Kofleriaceae bacterium]